MRFSVPNRLGNIKSFWTSISKEHRPPLEKSARRGSFKPRETTENTRCTRHVAWFDWANIALRRRSTTMLYNYSAVTVAGLLAIQSPTEGRFHLLHLRSLTWCWWLWFGPPAPLLQRHLAAMSRKHSHWETWCHRSALNSLNIQATLFALCPVCRREKPLVETPGRQRRAAPFDAEF